MLADQKLCATTGCAIPNRIAEVLKLRSANQSSPRMLQSWIRTASSSDSLEQLQHDSALLCVRIFAGDKIADQIQLRIVDHQAVARQRCTPETSQDSQTLFTGRQMVAIDDAHPKPGNQRLLLRYKMPEL